MFWKIETPPADCFVMREKKSRLKPVEQRELEIHMLHMPMAALFSHHWSSHGRIFYSFVLKHQSRRIAIIDCHGGDQNGIFVLSDNRTGCINGEKFIAELDGHYACIVCFACNPSKYVPMMQRSAVVMFQGNLPLLGYWQEDGVEQGKFVWQEPGGSPEPITFDYSRAMRDIELHPDLFARMASDFSPEKYTHAVSHELRHIL